MIIGAEEAIFDKVETITLANYGAEQVIVASTLSLLHATLGKYWGTDNVYKA